MAARRRNPSHASSSSACACAIRAAAVVLGVVSGSPSGTVARLQPARELAPKRRAQRVDRRFVARLGAADGRFEGVERLGQREGMPLGDERAEAAREPGQLLEFSRLRHQR